MGEVYRARDERLSRDVAVKVLRERRQDDPDALRRFEREARLLCKLSHPNVLAVYDVGEHQAGPYLVTELLEGRTLRELLGGGPLPPRKAVECAVAIAGGLFAAHERGIIHRDLKPENVFVTSDARIKILDFGLAKLTNSAAAASDETTPDDTALGDVLGTAGYMSPEQVRGEAVDHRSDIFALGAVLYEMLSGERAFMGPTRVETLNAVLKEEPKELSVLVPAVSPALERVVRRCLEKRPEERFQSTRDVAFALEAVSTLSAPAIQARRSAPGTLRKRWAARPVARALVALVVLAALALGGITLLRRASPAPPSYAQLTFRRGGIASARFATDGHAVLYSAAWDGGPQQLFLTMPGSPESRVLESGPARVLSVSANGQLAVALDRIPTRGPDYMAVGTLAVVAMSGGGVRELLTSVRDADWVPGTDQLAVAHEIGGMNRLELPVGTVLYQSSGWIADVRVSPNGQSIAFIDHPVMFSEGGAVALVDRAGHKKTLTSDLGSVRGLAWSPSGDEVWFTGGATGSSRSLRAVTPSGRQRVLATSPGGLVLKDVARDGRVLVTRESRRFRLFGRGPEDARERELSALDSTVPDGLSEDGRTLLFHDTGPEGSGTAVTYARGTDGSAAVRLQEGYGTSLSSDGKWAILWLPKARKQIVLVPIGPGASRTLDVPVTLGAAQWFPDGTRVVVAGREDVSGPLRSFVVDVASGKSRPLTEPGVLLDALVFRSGRHVSPDGKLVLVHRLDGLFLYPAGGGAARRVPGVGESDEPIGWSADGRVFLRDRGSPERVWRLDTETGRRELWREVSPPDTAGSKMLRILVTSRGDAYVYHYGTTLSELFLADGMQ
jgi:Tol biopolymer transport system component